MKALVSLMAFVRKIFMGLLLALVLFMAVEVVASLALVTGGSHYRLAVTEAYSKVSRLWHGPAHTMEILSREEGGPTRGVREDDLLGYAYQPGSHAITLRGRDGELTFTLTVDALGRRVTSFLPVPGKARVLVFGDSVSSGWLNDDATSFPFLLQARTPEFQVSNLAVPGYGPVQSYLQARELAESGETVEVVFLTFADYFTRRAVGGRGYFNALQAAPAAHAGSEAGEFSAWALPVVRQLGVDGQPVIEYVPIRRGATEDDVMAELSSEVQRSIVHSLYAGVRAAFPESRMVLLYTHGNAGPEARDLFAALRQSGLVVCDARPPNALLRDDFQPLDGHPGPKTQNWFATVAEGFLRTGQCAPPA